MIVKMDDLRLQKNYGYRLRLLRVTRLSLLFSIFPLSRCSVYTASIVYKQVAFHIKAWMNKQRSDEQIINNRHSDLKWWYEWRSILTLPCIALSFKTNESKNGSAGKVCEGWILSRDDTVSFNLKKQNSCRRTSLLCGDKQVICEMGKQMNRE